MQQLRLDWDIRPFAAYLPPISPPTFLLIINALSNKGEEPKTKFKKILNYQAKSVWVIGKKHKEKFKQETERNIRSGQIA